MRRSAGPPGLCRRAPPPGTRLPPALGSGPPSSCRRAHEELFKAASRCLRRPRGAAHPGRSLRLVLPPAISPCSRQAAISATCLQGRKKGREELLPLNTRFYSGGDDSSSLSPADQDSQLRGAGLPGEVSISCHRAPGPARGGVAPRPSRRGFGDWRFLACPRQPAGGCCACGQRGHSLLPGELGRLAPRPPPRRGTRAGGGAPRLLSPACRQVADCTCPHPGALGGPPQKQRLRQGHGCGESGRGIGVLGRPKQSTSDWGIGTTETCSGPALRAGGPRCGCGPALAGRGARPRPLPAPGAAGPPADTSARRRVPGHVALSSVCPVLIKAPVVGRALVQWDFVLTNHISRDCISKSGPFWGPGGHELRRILFDPVQGRCPRSRGTGGGRVEDGGKADEVFCWPGGPRSQPHWGPPQRMWDAPLNCPFEGRGAGHLSIAPRPWAACPLAEQASPWRHAERGAGRGCHTWRAPHTAGGAQTPEEQQLGVPARCSRLLRTPGSPSC